MDTLFSGNFAVAAGEKTYSPMAMRKNLQRAGHTLQIDIRMTGTAFPTGTTTVTVGVSTDDGATYREASGAYVAPFAEGKGGGVPDQHLGFTIGDTTTVTHARVKTSAPSAFALPVTITAAEV